MRDTFNYSRKVAKKFKSLDTAAIVSTISSITYFHEVENKNHHDGAYWHRMSVKAFKKYFDFWTPDQIRRKLQKAIDDGAIITGNYNTDPSDRTKWYSLGPAVLAIWAKPQKVKQTPKKPVADLPTVKGLAELPNDLLKKVLIKKKKKEKKEIPISEDLTKKGDGLSLSPSDSDKTDGARPPASKRVLSRIKTKAAQLTKVRFNEFINNLNIVYDIPKKYMGGYHELGTS